MMCETYRTLSNEGKIDLINKWFIAMRCLYVFLVWNKDLLNLSSARIFMYLLKILYSNSANMSLGHLCKQIHPIAFPEFPLHMQKKVLRMVSLIFYKLQNTFNKILSTGWTVWGSNSDGGKSFRTCPYRPCGHPATCTMGSMSFPDGKEWPGRDAEYSPFSSVVVMKG